MAASIFNYSKWDNIELSDDESDLHPNIDKDSWFRLKHRTRLEREAKEDEEIKKMEKLNTEDQVKLNLLKPKLERIKSGTLNDDAEIDDVEAMEGEIDEISKAIEVRNKYILDVKERRKWNIDNICKVKEEKTVIGSSTTQSLKADDFKPTGQTESLTQQKKTKKKEYTTEILNEKEGNETVGKAEVKNVEVGPRSLSPNREKFAVISYNDFVLLHENTLEYYSVISDLDSTRDYLFKHCDVLLHEHAQSYMLLSTLEDEMNGKKERSKLVSRQSQILSHIQELGNSMHRDPRDVTLAFFKRIQENQYLNAFIKAVDEFHDRIKQRAIVKRKEMDEESRNQKQLGPGGLDPVEVFESLPTALQDAFNSQDISKLQQVLASMDVNEAKTHMKRCVDSGLWVPKDEDEFND